MNINKDDIEECLSPLDAALFNSEIDLPLYDGSKFTVLEGVAKAFSWFTPHPGTSKKCIIENAIQTT